MNRNESWQAEQDEHGRNLPINVRRPTRDEEYSGFLIVRLSGASGALPTEADETLLSMARNRQLPGLATALEQFNLSTARRVVRSLPPADIQRLELQASNTGLLPADGPPHSLAAYWRIDVRQNMGQIDEILQRLEALDEVDLVYKELAVSDPGGKSGCDPRVNPTDDPYFKAQGYLEAAPLGIDARWVWNQANGVGEGVALIDLEQGWILDHEDLACKSPTLLYGDNRHGVGTYRGDHGAAVLGEVVAVDNRIGVVGIAPGVTSVRVVSHYDAETGTVLHVADAIVAATNALSAGDVLLLEVQRNYLPTEVDDVDFEAIRLAVARGIIVVEAAGNGGDDLDNYTNPAGERILNRTDSKFRESGAIMVGAAQSPLPHDRASFSNYGSRIDCYGWGENIVTCGYGNLDAGFGESSTYTNTFGGTSGASPMVTGAALLLQGMYQAATGKRLSPTQMRELLSNPATGTPQGRNVAGHIGVMPNLRAIVESRRSVCDWA